MTLLTRRIVHVGSSENTFVEHIADFIECNCGHTWYRFFINCSLKDFIKTCFHLEEFPGGSEELFSSGWGRVQSLVSFDILRMTRNI
jgi:hypothetical protein